VKLPVIITPGEDGCFVAEIPVIPGCISQGKTRKEALSNVKEAAETMPGKYGGRRLDTAQGIYR